MVAVVGRGGGGLREWDGCFVCAACTDGSLLLLLVFLFVGFPPYKTAPKPRVSRPPLLAAAAKAGQQSVIGRAQRPHLWSRVQVLKPAIGPGA